jgi:hypothetical protein
MMHGDSRRGAPRRHVRTRGAWMRDGQRVRVRIDWRARPGAALLIALAVLVLLMAIALALHAVTLRERRSARRATLVAAARDAADAGLARWQVRLASGDSVVAQLAADPPGMRHVLEVGEGAGAGDVPSALVTPAYLRVSFVSLSAGVRLLVSEASATAGLLVARRRVALALVTDSVRAAPIDTTPGALAPWVRRFVPAPERAWVELP